MSDRKSLWTFLDIKSAEFDITLNEKQVQLLRKDQPSEITNEVLKETADRFHLCNDNVALEYLSQCLKESEETVIGKIKDLYSEKQHVDELTNKHEEESVVTTCSHVKKEEHTDNVSAEELQEIACTVQKLKNNQKSVEDFIKDFFWKKIEPDADESTPSE